MSNRYIYGKEEAKQKIKPNAVEAESKKSLPESEDALFALNTIGSMTESVSSTEQSDLLQKLWEDVKHISCPHSLSCTQYVIQVIMILITTSKMIFFTCWYIFNCVQKYF